jgi:predicted nucleotidyltransferase
VIGHAEIGEILCFTHTYVGQALTGETVEAAGAVEACDDGRKRLVVGSSREAAGEFVRVANFKPTR